MLIAKIKELEKTVQNSFCIVAKKVEGGIELRGNVVGDNVVFMVIVQCVRDEKRLKQFMQLAALALAESKGNG